MAQRWYRHPETLSGSTVDDDDLSGRSLPADDDTLPPGEPHAAAEYCGRPRQWLAVISQDLPDGGGRRTHWRGSVHRTPDLAIAQAQAHLAAEVAP